MSKIKENGWIDVCGPGCNNVVDVVDLDMVCLLLNNLCTNKSGK